MTTNSPSAFPKLICIFAAFALPTGLPAQETAAPPDTSSADVRESVTYDLGDRLFTVQRVTEETIPIRLAPPKPDPTATPVRPIPTPAEMTEASHVHFLSMGGSTYLTESGSTRSLITWYSASSVGTIVFWSSVDWDLLRPGNFTTAEGESYSLLLMLSSANVSKEALAGCVESLPPIPSFSEGSASYRIVSGSATPEVTQTLDALHRIYDRDLQMLLTLRQEREQARIEAAAAALLPQPPPDDIVSQYREMTPEELENR